MEQINNHSPLPWHSNDGFDRLRKVDTIFAMHSDLEIIARLPQDKMLHDSVQDPKANASFIVTACNSYYPDQETISALTERVRELEDGLAKSNEICVGLAGEFAAFLEGLSDGSMNSNEMDNVKARCVENLKKWDALKARALLTPKNNGE